ncbi:DUF3180 family protein [Protaetiibacter larvae]|uniref:DUF3180 family protein n=1 Tax=Protaetiibacter larvae TaxID=2592654 RepID=UPI001FE58960|nr:DUF3180 family protein [Protaetiibacter larvae]
MTRTRPGALVLLAGIGAVAAFLLQLGLGALGYSKLVPQLSLSVTLAVIAVVVVALAVPIRRATRSTVKRRVDPFYATRVVLIAKASSITGSLLAGGAAGVLVELLVRPVSASSSVWSAVAMLVAALLLLAAGLVAESLCTVPPDDDERHPPGTAAS